MTELVVSGGGLAGVLVILGTFLGAVGAGFMRYLWKKCQQLDKDNRELRAEFEAMKSEARVRDKRHQEDRTRDYNLITSLQNKLVALQVYIASLRGMLAELNITSPEPPVLHEVAPVHPSEEVS